MDQPGRPEGKEIERKWHPVNIGKINQTAFMEIASIPRPGPVILAY